MPGISPPTPPSTAPTSPSHPAGHTGRDCVININVADPEKDAYNKAYSDPSLSATVADGGMGNLHLDENQAPT